MNSNDWSSVAEQSNPPQSQCAMVSGFQYCTLLTMPLSMTCSFRMHAFKSDFLAFAGHLRPAGDLRLGQPETFSSLPASTAPS